MGIFAKLTGFDKFLAQQNALFMHRLVGSAPFEQRKAIAAKAVEQVFMATYGASPGQVADGLSALPRGVQMQILANAALELRVETGIRNAIFTRIKNPMATVEWFSDKEMAYTVDATQKTFRTSFQWPGNDVRIDFAETMFGRGSTQLDAHRRSMRSAA